MYHWHHRQSGQHNCNYYIKSVQQYRADNYHDCTHTLHNIKPVERYPGFVFVSTDESHGSKEPEQNSYTVKYGGVLEALCEVNLIMPSSVTVGERPFPTLTIPSL